MRGTVFLDIGANVGMYSHLLRKNFEKIIAVEANPEVYQRLQKEVSGIENIQPLWAAISDSDGEVALYRTDMCDTILSKFEYRPLHAPLVSRFQEGKSPQTVPSLTIDSLLTRFNLSFVDVMKVDVEGAEFLVLKGASESLSQGKISKITIELHDREQKTELEEVLKDYGYHLRWIDSDHILASRTSGAS